MISIFAWIARSLLRTVDNMATPCSVKAYGAYRLPPRPLFEVAICDLKNAPSSEVSWNMKSFGNRGRLRLTCSFRRLVVTPYRTARSASSMTLWTSNQDDESLNPFARQHGCHSLDTIPYHLGASNSKLGGYYAICWRDDKDGPRCAV